MSLKKYITYEKLNITSSPGICNSLYYNGSYLLLFEIYCYCYLPYILTFAKKCLGSLSNTPLVLPPFSCY